MDSPQDATQLLRTGLNANGVFSLATGLLLTLAPATVGDWLGVSIDGWLRILGLALLGHAGLLAFAARQEDPHPLGKLNFLAVAPYPLLMIAVVLLGLVDRPLGQALVLADGVIVGAIAAVQGMALRKPNPTLSRNSA